MWHKNQSGQHRQFEPTDNGGDVKSHRGLKLPFRTAMKSLPFHRLVAYLRSVCRRRSHCRRRCHRYRCPCFPRERCFLKGKRERERERRERNAFRSRTCHRKVQILGSNHAIKQRGSVLVSHCCHVRSRLHGAELHQTPIVLLSNVFPALFCRFVTFIVLFLPLLLFSSYSEKDTKWQLLECNIPSYTSRRYSNKSHAGTYPRKRHHIVFFGRVFFFTRDKIYRCFIK